MKKLKLFSLSLLAVFAALILVATSSKVYASESEPFLLLNHNGIPTEEFPNILPFDGSFILTPDPLNEEILVHYIKFKDGYETNPVEIENWLSILSITELSIHYGYVQNDSWTQIDVNLDYFNKQPTGLITIKVDDNGIFGKEIMISFERGLVVNDEISYLPNEFSNIKYLLGLADPYEVIPSNSDFSIPHITGNATVENDINNPMTIEQIMIAANLQAHDDFYGDLTTDITQHWEFNEYTDNETELGEYRIEFEVENDSGFKDSFTVTVINADLSDPTEGYVPAISGEHTVINDVDNPFEASRFMDIAQIAAFDEYYGNITNLIITDASDYESKKHLVGDSEIIYTVTNDSGLTASFTLIVATRDLTKPVISGPGVHTIEYQEVFGDQQIRALFSVTDNYDSNIQLVIASNSYIGNERTLGTYQIKLTASDTSHNTAVHMLTLKVIDKTAPIIEDENSGIIQVNWKDIVTNEMLLMKLTAYDEIDGDLTSYIKVIENPITATIGKYTVKYEVSDVSGNKTIYTRTYQVVTTDVPIFWVSENLLLISEVNILNNDQLAQELARYHNINMASYTVVNNEYTGNENTPGAYSVMLAIADNTGQEHLVSRTIQVFEADELPEEQISFWKKIENFFTKIWNFIVKIVTAIWKAIKWVWDKLFGWMFK